MQNWSQIEPLIQLVHTTAAVLGVYVTLCGIRLNWMMHNRINRQNNLNTLMIALGQFRRLISGNKPDVSAIQTACEELHPAIQISLGHLPPEFSREYEALLTHIRLWLDLRNEEHRLKNTLLPAKDQLVGMSQRIERINWMCTHELIHISNYRPNFFWLGRSNTPAFRVKPQANPKPLNRTHPDLPFPERPVSGGYFDSGHSN